MKLKMEELSEIPLRVINELQEIKQMEENQKNVYTMYREKEIVIKRKYMDLERLIKTYYNE